MSYTISLPEGITLKPYAEYLLLIGPDLDANRYQTIKKKLPGEIARRLMGWRKIGSTAKQEAL
ncbi:MAG: hypothetical protein VB050_13245 [Geobacteraceae bacterium]|nr:hypothetical protein [Geobacteraceae bacterium]